jgi:recombination protein RecA
MQLLPMMIMILIITGERNIMAKRKKNDNDILKHLKGFCQRGARVSSPGNIPTGHFKLDFAIQYGMDPSKVDLNKMEGYDPKATLGIPLGKLVEIFGEEGSGKSSLAYRIAGYAQKLGHEVAWIDCEHSFQENLAYINGCDVDSLIYSDMVNHDNPDDDCFYAEDVVDSMLALMNNGVSVIVLDSVANLIPKALMEAKSEQQFMGLLPRLLSTTLGKLVSYAEKNGTLLIFINQLREKLGVVYGDNETSPGGHSLKHNASLRLKISKITRKDAEIRIIDEDTGEESLIGKHSRVKIIKNRFAKPFTESLEIPMYYEAYFPEIEDVVFDTGRQIKLISVRQGVFNWNGLKIEGKRDFINHIKENNLIDSLIADVTKVAKEKDILLPPEIVLYEPKIKKERLEDVKMEKQISSSGKEKDSRSSEDNDKETGRKNST